MKKERMFGRFDIVHTCTSHTDKLWTDEIFVDPWDKNAVETGIQEIKEAFRKHAACHPNVFVWIKKPIIQEKDSYGIFYKEWESVTHKDWTSSGILRIVRPVSWARKFL